jgi:hypothetical protein
MPAKVPFTSTDLTYKAPVTLGDEKYIFTMDWNFRSNAWHASVVRGSDQVQLVAYRRVSPGGTLLNIAAGKLFVYGKDPYDQGSFATGELVVLFFTTEEIATLLAAQGRDPEMKIV